MKEIKNRKNEKESSDTCQENQEEEEEEQEIFEILKEDYFESLNETKTDNMSIIDLEKLSEKNVYYYDQIIQYLIEKSFVFSDKFRKELNQTINYLLFVEADKKFKSTKELDVILQEIYNLTAFGYFSILSSLMKKASQKFLNKFIVNFNKTFVNEAGNKLDDTRSRDIYLDQNTILKELSLKNAMKVTGKRNSDQDLKNFKKLQ